MKQHHLSPIIRSTFLVVGLISLLILIGAKQKSLANKQAVLEEPASLMGVFAGSVTDAFGNPIEGAVLYWGLDYVHPEYHQRAVTDAQGRYWLETRTTLKSQSHLSVVAEGYAPIWEKRTSPGTQERPKEVNFTLEEGHWLEVSVVDKDGEPIPDVEVTPHFNQKYGVAELPGYKSLQTDAQGCVLLEHLPAHNVRLNLTGNQLTFKQMTTEVDKEITITMNPAMIIRGQVLDKESELPITDFKVRVYSMVVPEELRKGRWFSDPEGRFTLTNLQVPRILELVIEAEGYPAVYAGEVEPQSPTKAKEKAYYLPHGQLTKGVLLDEATGEPMPWVTITSVLIRSLAVNGYSVDWSWLDKYVIAKIQIVTDKNGEFTFLEEKSEWPKGYAYSDKAYMRTRTLFIQFKGYEKLIIRPSDRAQYKTQTGDLRIPLAPGASVSGVYSINGQPQSNVNIYIVRHGGQSFGWVMTDSEGRFHWDDLPAGEYILRGPFEYRLMVEKGEHKNINLGEDMGTCTLSGWAFKEGKTLACAIVTLCPTFEWQFRELSSRTDNEGRYQFEGLKPGKYEAYPDGRIITCLPNDYGPEIIEINGDTKYDFDFQKRR